MPEIARKQGEIMSKSGVIKPENPCFEKSNHTRVKPGEMRMEIKELLKSKHKLKTRQYRYNVGC